MSVCVYFRSDKSLKPKTIFEELANRAKKIVVTSAEYPCLKFGSHMESLRGIEINQEENGYQVRVCSFANRADLQLYGATVNAMKDLTGAKALYEDDDEQVIDNPTEYFNDEWIKEQLDSSLRINCTLVKHYGKPIIMDGLFLHFCFGPFIANAFDLDLDDPCYEDIHTIQDYLVKLQWVFADKESTSTRMVMPDPENEEARPLTISLIYAENGQVKPFDYVSYADIVCLMDKDKDVSMIHMEDFWKILPREGFTFMDDYQYAKEGDMSYDTFLNMQNRARLYHVDNLFHRPTYPGDGYDEKQKTYVLMWNPDISSVKMEDHVNSIQHLLTESYNWSVYEYQEAKKGDRFVMVRCGKGKTGIVMSGIFDSNPYQAGDWSGKGRKVFYMDLQPNFIADPENAEIITTAQLTTFIPSFDWGGGHSGRLLTDEQARKLEKMLAHYLPRFNNNIDGETVNGYSLPQGDDL